jgi:hypothetical protein
VSDSEVKGVSITLALLALSALTVLGALLQSLKIEKISSAQQLTLMAERVTALKTASEQAGEAIAHSEPQIRRAAEIETQYVNLFTELLELAKIDPDARSVTQKWKIKASGESNTPQVQAEFSESQPAKAVTTPAKPKVGQ